MAGKNKINLYDVVPATGRHLSYIERPDGNIMIIIPRFRNKRMRRFMAARRKCPDFYLKLDSNGSAVWKLIDGNRTVMQMVEELADHFGNEENYEYRILKFIMTLRHDSLITYENPASRGSGK
ncbi:MAG: PqqD family protein [Bacteroidales bacterium]|jgi:hypothetical protein|nr:PqqD family protein [Bacteroidales bacterium]